MIKEQPKQVWITNAAIEYAIKEDAGEGDEIKIDEKFYDFIAGAKSHAARDYWYAKFKQEQDKN
jgi:hypothetical protein